MRFGPGLGLTELLCFTACGRLGFDSLDTNQGLDAGAGGAGGTLADIDASGPGGSGGTTGDAGVAGGAPPAGGRSAGGGPSTGGRAPGAGGDDAGAPDAPPSTCGNASVESGEECDDGAATALCDADCTFASCGDGVTNAAAGEGCDDGDRPGGCTVACVPETCRAGCTCEWYRGARYMLCDEPLTWAPAAAACAAEGMYLVRIASATEQTWLRFRTLAGGLGKFHLGAGDGAPEGTWVWVDGTPFWQGLAAGAPIGGEYNEWANGEPNVFVAGENCSEVQSLRGWNDCVCDLTKPTVCKEYRAPRAACGNGWSSPARLATAPERPRRATRTAPRPRAATGS